MPPFFASLESILVFVAIVLISGVSNWLKQRQERKQAEAQGDLDPLRPRPAEPSVFGEEADGPAAPSRRPLDWQEELRRMLEGDDSRRPPPLPPQPRPIAPAPPRPMPVFDEVPAPRPAPVVVARSVRPVARVEPAATTADEGQSDEGGFTYQSSPTPFPTVDLAELAKSQLKATLRQTGTAAPSAMTSRAGRATDSVRRLKSRLADPVAARQAILLATILGPPRALDPIRPGAQ